MGRPAPAHPLEHAERRLSLTGTPFRSDTAPIPFIAYEPDADGVRRSSADYTYGYGDALKDHVVRPVIFLAYSGQMRWRTSAGEEMAAELGAFPDYQRNAKNMLRVMRNHRRAAYGETAGYEKLAVNPVPLVHSDLKQAALGEHAKSAWDRAIALGEQHGYRNAQATVIAPTGTIGLVMDCDTTGIEPDFALVKFKKLAGGGYFKIINSSVPPALKRLGYSDSQIEEMVRYCRGSGSLAGCPHINPAALKAKGFSEDTLARIERELPSAFEMPFVFTRWTLRVLWRTARPSFLASGVSVQPCTISETITTTKATLKMTSAFGVFASVGIAARKIETAPRRPTHPTNAISLREKPNGRRQSATASGRVMRSTFAGLIGDSPNGTNGSASSPRFSSTHSTWPG